MNKTIVIPTRPGARRARFGDFGASLAYAFFAFCFFAVVLKIGLIAGS